MLPRHSFSSVMGCCSFHFSSRNNSRHHDRQTVNVPFLFSMAIRGSSRRSWSGASTSFSGNAGIFSRANSDVLITMAIWIHLRFVPSPGRVEKSPFLWMVVTRGEPNDSCMILAEWCIVDESLHASQLPSPSVVERSPCAPPRGRVVFLTATVAVFCRRVNCIGHFGERLN